MRRTKGRILVWGRCCVAIVRMLVVATNKRTYQLTSGCVVTASSPAGAAAGSSEVVEHRTTSPDHFPAPSRLPVELGEAVRSQPDGVGAASSPTVCSAAGGGAAPCNSVCVSAATLTRLVGLARRAHGGACELVGPGSPRVRCGVRGRGKGPGGARSSSARGPAPPLCVAAPLRRAAVEAVTLASNSHLRAARHSRLAELSSGSTASSPCCSACGWRRRRVRKL